MKGTRSLLIPNLVLKFPKKWPKSIWNSWKKGRKNCFQNSTAPQILYSKDTDHSILGRRKLTCPLALLWEKWQCLLAKIFSSVIRELPASSGLGIAEKNVFFFFYAVLSYPCSLESQTTCENKICFEVATKCYFFRYSFPHKKPNSYKASEAFSSPVQWWEGRSQHNHVRFAELL